MHHTSQKPAKNRQIRIAALSFLMVFIVSILLSGAFVLAHADHSHDHHGVGGSCAVCVQIQNAENTLKLLCMVAVGVSVILAGLYVTTTVKPICFRIAAITPVSSRIRMND